MSISIYRGVELRPSLQAGTRLAYTPDILGKRLDVVFCGINPSSSAEIAGHNFSSRSNRFWRVLHLAGFTDRCLAAEEERHLLDYGCGITAIVDRATKRAQEVPASEFKAAKPAFEAKIRRYRPRVIAFLGKHGFAGMMGEVRVEWGFHPQRIAGSAIWILPNPSGLNRAFTIDTLAMAYGELRAALSQDPRLAV